jgi:hypothetical protein
VLEEIDGIDETDSLPAYCSLNDCVRVTIVLLFSLILRTNYKKGSLQHPLYLTPNCKLFRLLTISLA